MNLKQRIDQDLKRAMLDRNQELVSVLRGLKSAILNVEIEKGNRDTGLSDEDVTVVIQKESKKRQESAELYNRGKNSEKESQEIKEKDIIDKYLPSQIEDEQLQTLVDDIITKNSWSSVADMGKIIGAVKGEVGATADGGRIARVVKESLPK